MKDTDTDYLTNTYRPEETKFSQIIWTSDALEFEGIANTCERISCEIDF